MNGIPHCTLPLCSFPQSRWLAVLPFLLWVSFPPDRSVVESTSRGRTVSIENWKTKTDTGIIAQGFTVNGFILAFFCEQKNIVNHFVFFQLFRGLGTSHCGWSGEVCGGENQRGGGQRVAFPQRTLFGSSRVNAQTERERLSWRKPAR